MQHHTKRKPHLTNIFLFFLFCFLAFSSSLFSQTGHWTQLFPSNSPSPRDSYGFAYLKNGIVLLFGGDDSTKNNHRDDTWIFDLNKNIWTEIKTEPHPSGRSLPAMGYISEGKAILFGGELYDFPKYSDETWLFDLDSLKWSLLHVEKNPSLRDRASCSYIGDNKFVIFSGFPPQNQKDDDYCKDTWVFDLKTQSWDSLQQASPWTPREQGMMAELDDHRALLYGGYNVGSDLNDYWIFDRELVSNYWWGISPRIKNLIRGSSSMLNISANHLIVFGGNTIGNDNSKPEDQWSNDTWVFNGDDTTWNKLDLEVKPEGRYYHKMVKLSDGKALLFGGIGHINGKSHLLNDTWLFEYKPTNVQDENKDNVLNLSPNPATDFLEITVGANGCSPLSDIEIYDVFAQKLFSSSHYSILTTQYSARLDVSGLSPGIYFVKVGGRFGKFVKI